jgi:predicted nucleic acid-binding protein
VRVLYEAAALIDTAAVVALFDSSDGRHEAARLFFAASECELTWFAVDATSHESYTRIRYNLNHATAAAAFGWLRSDRVRTLRFQPEDEDAALRTLKKYHDHALSFHDALCAAIMLRIGIYKVFTFDRDFWTMGFQVVPGTTA